MPLCGNSLLGRGRFAAVYSERPELLHGTADARSWDCALTTADLADQNANRALEALLDERVHLLICINLLENSGTDDRTLGHHLTKRLRIADSEIAQLRCDAAPEWRVRSMPKIARLIRRSTAK